jgi:signal transduction histidine kinase
VFIEASVHPAAGAAPAMLHIIVDDDGQGLSDAERMQASQRGRRLDETKPGSGLGLSIVTDLAALYGGSLTLGLSPIGGLRAELVLPAA